MRYFDVHTCSAFSVDTCLRAGTYTSRFTHFVNVVVQNIEDALLLKTSGEF